MVTKSIRCNISPHILVATNYTVRPGCLFSSCAVVMINDAKLMRNILQLLRVVSMCVCPSVKHFPAAHSSPITGKGRSLLINQSSLFFRE